MLKYKDKDGILTSIVKYSDLYIEEVLEYGDKTLCFSIPVIYAENILLENYILTKTDEYVIKQKNTDDAGNYVITAKLNIDELEGSLFQSFETEEKTAVDTANLALAGTGWLCECEVLKKRTIRLTNVSVWEILKKIADTFILEIQIDSVNKRIIFKEKIGEDKGVYFADQLNLISLEMQSNTSDFYTRLLPLGKDGLTIESVNDGKKYVENYTYSSKVKTFLWKDDRYTDAQSLKDDAAAKLADMAQPYTAYSCKIFDMAQYSNLYKEFFIGDTVTIINKETKMRIQQRIVKTRRYPDNHSNDTCEISNLKLTFDEYIQKYNDTSNTVNNITTDNGTVDGDSINNIDASKILRLDEVIAANAKFNEVSAELLNVTKQLNAANAKIGTLETTKISATEADLKYAKIDLTNIEAGSIKTAMIEIGAIGTAQIADGSITDAKIVGMTADKITAGTIDAAVIKVTHIDAASITVGQINGTQIASGSVDMSKLGSDVSAWISTTKSSVDKALKDAGLANTNADTAVTAADSAVSIANGKSTSYYQKTAPSGGTYKVNDIWFDTDDGYKMYYWNGSAWSAAQYGSSAISANAITSEKIASNAVTAGKIAAGAVTANNIAANAVTAGKIATNAVTTATIAAGAITTDKISASAVTAAKIAIADYTDYATINENIPTSAITGRALISDGYLIKTLQSSSAMMLCDFTLLSFNSSDEIYYEYTIKGETSGNAFTTIWYYDSEKKYLSAISSSAYEVTTQDNKISGTLKPKNLPSNAAYFIVGITDATATKIQLYVKKAKFIRKSGTTLISDGAITTDKIVAQAVTGAKIAASTITANNIAANAVTADKINVSSLSAISANLGTITAGIIQSTNYVANSTGMKLNLATGVWDSKYFKINSAGEITASAGTIGGWNITDNSLYGDYDAYRSYIQTAKSADTWVFSAQEKRDGTYYGNWYVTADGRMYSKNKVVIDSSGKDTGSYILMETWGTSGDKHQTKTNGLEYRAHNLTNDNYAYLQASGIWFGNEAEANIRGSINLSSSNLMQTTFDIYRTKNANGVLKGWFRDTVFVMQDGWNNNAIYADWNGNFSCTGTKNRIVETENFGQVKMNAFETAGAHFADVVSGKIAADGKCVIYFNRKFAETIDRDCEYQVILTAVGKASELYVIKDEEYFTVCGQTGTDFDCMIIGRQKGYVTSYADSVDFSKLGEEVSGNVID